MQDTTVLNRVGEMFSNVYAQEHGSVVLVFLLGLLFGGIIQYTRVAKFEKIAGFAMLKDTTVPKMLFLTVGITSIGLYYMIDAGFASYGVKPMIINGLIIGGVLFGVSMAILGKCPGTGPVSIAEGRVDVLIGAIGGLLGALLFTIYYDDIFKPIMGESIGKLVLSDLFPGSENITVLMFGVVIIIIAIAIPNIELHDDEEEKNINEIIDHDTKMTSKYDVELEKAEDGRNL